MRTCHFLLAVPAILLVISCQKEQEKKEDPVVPNVEIPTESQAIFSQGMSFDAGTESKSQTVKFKTTANWTSDVTDTKASEWLSVSPSSGSAGSVTMNVTAKPNTERAGREASVSIKCGTDVKKFTVKQAGIIYYDVESVSLNLSELALEEGEQVQLIATILPENASDKSVTWESSNKDVATVENGIVTAVSEGEAIITVTTVDGDKTSSCSVTVIPPTIKAIDLGLSVNWASFNVGAKRPEDYGGYYAWGETEEKAYHSNENYKWGILGSITKYNSEAAAGVVDYKTQLDEEDDVAHVVYGDGWRMPTRYEQKELLTKCLWTWTTMNGVSGCELTSKINGNTIFLPAAGMSGTTGPHNGGMIGLYWSSSLDYSQIACALSFDSNEPFAQAVSSSRSYGLSIRPVVTNPNYVSVEKIVFSKERIEIKEGDSENLSVTLIPSNATDKTITWSSSDESIATVDCGIVTAIRAGRVIITATADDASSSCEVIVNYISENETIVFKESDLKAKLVKAFDTNADGELSYSEAAAVKTGEQLMSAVGENVGFSSFDEFQFFTGITELIERQFEGWWALRSIVLPDSLISIGWLAFDQTLIESIRIPDGVTYIGGNAFFKCPLLKSIKLSKSLETIWSSAFSGCTLLESITIPENVKLIAAGAFSGCIRMRAVKILASVPPECYPNAFSDTNNCPIYVPAESIDAYKSSSYWADYVDRIQPIPE